MKIKFMTDVPDKYTGQMYKEGEIKEFKEERAKEILEAKQCDGKPYAKIVEIENAKVNVSHETATVKKEIIRKPINRK